MDTYAEQIEGLNVTYEDYEPGYGTPHGVARTSEMYLRAEPATPTREALVAFADAVRRPPQLAASPQRLLRRGVFGAQWTLPDTSTPTKSWVGAQLQATLDAYVSEVDQRSWYGFRDYGDVMHSYDRDRHVWRYDVGGYAWGNSELSPDLWLWYSFLRTGREDAPTQPLPPVEDPPAGGLVGISGMSFGNAMAAWATEAERTNAPTWHDRIVAAMNGMASLPHGLFGHGKLNIDTGEVTPAGEGAPSQSHLRACFGLPEISVELIRTYGERAPKFADAWAEYGRLYNGTREQQQEALGTSFRNANLRDSHSRCTAFAAARASDPDVAARAWDELLGERMKERPTPQRPVRLEGPPVLNPVDEVPLGTNGSQWQLAAIECLSLLAEFPDEAGLGAGGRAGSYRPLTCVGREPPREGGRVGSGWAAPCGTTGGRPLERAGHDRRDRQRNEKRERPGRVGRPRGSWSMKRPSPACARTSRRALATSVTFPWRGR